MRAPLFWEEKNCLSAALLPASCIYGWFAARRQNTVPTKLSVPVICIGNLVAGGAGKTPVALALGALLKAKGKKAHYLSRGYLGRLQGPILVDANKHTVLEVGDEALLLAQMLPTWVAKDKLAGAQAAIAAGAELIILDDGFQNPVLHKDVSLLVVDGAQGFGNERLLPAGPLRETIEAGMARASAVIMMGEDSHNVLRYVPAGKTVLRARLEPAVATHALAEKRVVAFAGIAQPRKFYRTLQQVGCVIKKMVAYGDHYNFTPKDYTFLQSKAKEFEAILVTTTKDFVRLPDYMRALVTAMPVEAIFDDSDLLMKMVAL